MATDNWKPSRNDIEWSQRHFRLMGEGGAWGVTAGLIFRRFGDTLHLTVVMPWSNDMVDAHKNGMDIPGSAAELLEHQRRTFECIALCFRLIPVQVVDDTHIFEPNPVNPLLPTSSYLHHERN